MADLREQNDFGLMCIPESVLLTSLVSPAVLAFSELPPQPRFEKDTQVSLKLLSVAKQRQSVPQVISLKKV